LSGSGIDPNNRKAVLAETLAAMGISGVVGRLLELLVARSRMGDSPKILEELVALVEASKGVKAGQVKTAVELSQDELNVLGAALAKRVGGVVQLFQVVDPSLLGGVVATVSGKTFDASLRTQLERFKNELI
jgi:F-type H+-transporting ATPase subunit delta